MWRSSSVQILTSYDLEQDLGQAENFSAPLEGPGGVIGAT